MWHKVTDLFGIGKRSSQAEVQKGKRNSTGSKLLDIFDDSRFQEPEFIPSTNREILWATMDDPTYSDLSQTVSTVIMGLIIISCISFCIENDPNVRTISGGEQVFAMIEAICVVCFSVEFVLRVVSTPDYFDFGTDPLNWIDVIAVVPFYIQLIAGSGGADTAYVRV